ncbi:DUF899 domain-containing protein [Streptacidiphilus cavernicola]|uniref:DUF899 domain-containing protein n=1 Tax=Streptacidiphilus cavernicola TaxID=3342716 RepID=A0ABV6VQ87_9ACTN
MALPQVVSHEEWLVARRELLAREKEATRARDALNADRRRLPMVAVEKDYRFEGPDGEAGLDALFGGHRQLILQHVMFDPSWDEACQSCSAGLEEMSPGLVAHLAVRDTAFVLVSRAPLAKIEPYRERRGWPYPWYSSSDSDFNFDFHVSMDAAVAPVEYNYRDGGALEQAGQGWLLEEPMEMPGYSCFLRDGGTVFHTYSTFARGTEQLGGAYAFLDMTALGRQEEWEEPRGRADLTRPAMPNFAQ